MLNIAIHDKVDSVCIIAAESLYVLGYKKALNIILSYIKGPIIDMALFAAYRLQFVQDKNIIPRLEAIIDKISTEPLKNRIKKTIKILNNEINVEDILSCQEIIDKAYAAFENKKYKESEKLTRDALKLDESNADAYWILANIHTLEKKDTLSVIDEFKKALAYGYIDQVRILFSLSTFLLNQKKTHEAIGYLNEAIKLKQDPTIYYQLGVAYSYANKTKEAISATEEAIKLDKNYAMAHYNLSILYESIGNKDKASYHLKQYNQLQKKI
jgi:tetratricopeptide (TPR) repeat protein